MIAAHNSLPSIHPMKTLRITTAKTRKGVIAWLAKHNPFLDVEYVNESDYVAVHVCRYSGKIVRWELPDGSLSAYTYQQAA